MTLPRSGGPTPAQRAAFRRNALKALLLTFLGLIVTVIGQQVPDRLNAALFAVASALLMAVIIGLAVAAYFVGSYHEDRAALASRTAKVWGYLRRAGAWGLAAGGVGALLASALPPRLSGADPSNPAALPAAGFVATVLGGAGFAYDVAVNGRYFSQFDRTDPLDGPARDQAWSGTAHALIAELGVGSVTASTLQVGFGIAAIAAALSAVLILLGVGVVWAARPVAETETVKVTKRSTVPAAA